MPLFHTMKSSVNSIGMTCGRNRLCRTLPSHYDEITCIPPESNGLKVQPCDLANIHHCCARLFLSLMQYTLNICPVSTRFPLCKTRVRLYLSRLTIDRSIRLKYPFLVTGPPKYPAITMAVKVLTGKQLVFSSIPFALDINSFPNSYSIR